MKKYDSTELIIKNVINRSRKRNYDCVFFDFHDPKTQHFVSIALEKEKIPYKYFGGHEEAERKMLCLKEDDESIPGDFPIQLLRCESSKEFSHRDMLGVLMNIGIDRSVIGDILVDGKTAYLFIKESFEWHIMDQVDRIGNERVQWTVESTEDVDLPQKQFQSIRAVVASLRLDNVVSKAGNFSRKESEQLIRKGLVKVNHIEVYKPSAAVKESDLLSIRGKGRYLLKEELGTTKKGNINILLKKYV